MEESEIKKIAYNCRKATFLIEKKQLEKISVREELELKIHLAGCAICVTYQKQSLAINRMVKNLFVSSLHSELHLNENFKEELQKKIDNQLNEN
ncbi:hypothetical protein ABIB40_002605 [Pedobacter sp. UYP30]|uniref:hypothetical protein n=1 Tax=Pedobacter sp. UYP30 TaxID=1756400 RepID=UPI00339A8D9B